MKSLLVLAIMSCTFSSAWSKTYDLSHRFGVGGGGGSSIPITGNEFDREAEDDFVYNFHMRYQTHRADALQLSFTNLDFEETDITAKIYDLMYLYRVNPVDRMTPILGLGAGVADLSDFDPHDNMKIALRARAGLEYALSEDLFVSLAIDYHFINKMPDDDDGMPIGEIHALAPQLNLTWFFGHDKEYEKKPEPAAPQLVPVVIVNQATAPAESDGDSDGVGDSRDKCPNTPAGSVVNAYGCMQEEKASLKMDVSFLPGRSDLAASSASSLKALSDFMKQNPDTKIEIQGHTDSTGNRDKNIQLSQARANTVRTYMIETLGIPGERLIARGFGDSQPVADNISPEGRARNRRVMAIISQ